MAGPRMAWRHGLYGAPRRAPRAARRARPRHAAGHLLPHELPRRPAGHARGRAADRGQGLRRALRARPRLPQGAARPAAAALRSHRGRGRAVRLPRLHRLGAGDGSRARRARGAGLARQAHAAARAATRARWFFLGEIYCDLPLPVDAPETEHCGTCRRCIDVCPTQAIVGPYQLDARRCISYLTIEHKGADPRGAAAPHGQPRLWLRRLPARVPWNSFAQARRGSRTSRARNGLDAATLVELFAWTEDDFDERLRGSRDPPHRLRALAAQPRGRPRQRAGARRRSSRRCVPAWTIPRRWSGSTWDGH